MTETTFPKRRLLSLSAILILLLSGFSYLFAIGLAFVCIVMPLAMIAMTERRTQFWSLQAVLLLIVGVIIAGVILWSLIPRRDKIVKPGVELRLKAHPRLEQLILDTTVRLAEPMPDVVYVSGDTNAWVAERGGLLGIGSRRVMCLGWPLLSVMSVDELRGMIAHECAHFYTGDTWLGPRVYSARSAMSRILASLDSRSALVKAFNNFGLGRLLHLFVMIVLKQYWKLFFFLTHYVSRLQEYRSDELAAYLASPESVISGLAKTNRSEMIKHTFWTDVIYPALTAGALPHLAESFQAFATSPEIAKATQGFYSQMLERSKSDAYATHPPLKLRVERLEHICADSVQDDSPPALHLLDDLETLERDLIAVIFREINVQALKRTDWDEIGSGMYLKAWRALAESHREVLAAYTIPRIPELLANLSVLTSRISNPPGRLLTHVQRFEIAFNLLWQAFATQLVDIGWKLEVRPGKLYLTNGEQTIVPQNLVRSLIQEKIEESEWSAFCDKWGLTDLRLAAYSGQKLPRLS